MSKPLPDQSASRQSARPACPNDERAVLEAVLAFADECQYERGHSHQVTRLALLLFDSLQSLHKMGSRERFLLHCGGLLHDIGWAHGKAGHHKAALRMILQGESLPLTDRERLLVGLIARYHRKALPQDGHEDFARLDGEDRRRVWVLGGILRVADGLDRTHVNAVRDLRCEVSAERVVIRCAVNGPADEEILAASEKADLLESVFTRKIIIEPVAARR
ncbi:MAG TPA: HD domain-containing protein [Phycisphaerae bacterium]|nr:HD domain-containing protein [Phycisphaerae bacterium]